MAELAVLAGGFLLLGAVAFGGGQAALPLVERLAVGSGWVTPGQFSVGVALSYATPGPVLILATFVGFSVAGITGAVVATVAVFAVPVALAGLAARLVARLSGSPWLQAFGQTAGAAAIGLLGVTLLSQARPVVGVSPLLLLGSVAVAVAVATLRQVSPVLLLLTATAAGAVVAALT